MIGAIIQARMSSTRLPGKILKEVLGRPLFSYLVERLRYCKRIDEIIIATSNNINNSPIVTFCQQEGLLIFQGSEDDVLDRYYQAAKKFNVDHILRITSDCPFIDPGICDEMIDIYFTSNFDYIFTGPTFAEGLDCEIFSLNALEQAWYAAKLRSDREHVTQYLYNHPEIFRSHMLTNKTDDSKYRITLDEENDFLVIKSIMEALYIDKSHYISIEQIKNFLDANHSIFNLNAHIVRNEGLLKSLEKDGIIEK